MNDAMDPTLSANKVKHGRLAIITELSIKEVSLEFRDLFLYRKKFAFPHSNDLVPIQDHLYCLDMMADDLNGDKILPSLQNTGPNVFYNWLIHRPQATPPEKQDFHDKFLAQVDTLLAARKRKLTARQREIISKHTNEPLILVQGPPGTGKSYTLAWAILGRMANALMQGKPYRVAILVKRTMQSMLY